MKGVCVGGEGPPGAEGVPWTYFSFWPWTPLFKMKEKEEYYLSVTQNFGILSFPCAVSKLSNPSDSKFY